MNTSALASTLPGVAAWPGSNGKFGPTSIEPPMKGLSTCQSWMLEVPSILILLPDLAEKVVICSAADNDNVASNERAIVPAINVRLFMFIFLVLHIRLCCLLDVGPINSIHTTPASARCVWR